MRVRSLHLPLAAALGFAACTHAAAPLARSTPAEHIVPSGSLGTVNLPISCEAAVQADFNHALALLHHMTYTQARAAFRTVAERDPRCAMAQWGIAMTLFQPLWPTRPSAADLSQGLEATQKAQQLAPTSGLERGHIDAVSAFFHDPDAKDYWQRIDNWEAKSKALHSAYPDDPEASAFYALALLASARPGPSVEEHSRQAVALLRRSKSCAPCVTRQALAHPRRLVNGASSANRARFAMQRSDERPG